MILSFKYFRTNHIDKWYLLSPIVIVSKAVDLSQEDLNLREPDVGPFRVVQQMRGGDYHGAARQRPRH